MVQYARCQSSGLHFGVHLHHVRGRAPHREVHLKAAVEAPAGLPIRVHALPPKQEVKVWVLLHPGDLGACVADT